MTFNCLIKSSISNFYLICFDYLPFSKKYKLKLGNEYQDKRTLHKANKNYKNTYTNKARFDQAIDSIICAFFPIQM